MNKSHDITTTNGDATVTESPRRLTTRTKVAVGAGSAALLAFGLMLAGKVDNPVFFSSPEPSPEALAEANIDSVVDAIDDDDLIEMSLNDVLGEPDSDDDLLVGTEPIIIDDDLLVGTEPITIDDDGVPDGSDGLIIDDDNLTPGGDDNTNSPGTAQAPSLRNLCVTVVHGDAESGIWVSGEAYGLTGGTIHVEGPTIGGGDTIEIPVSDGVFNGELPIAQYADHPLTRFDIGSDTLGEPVDFLPDLINVERDVFPVGPDEGPIFDEECIEFPRTDLGAADDLFTAESAPVDAPADEVAVDATNEDLDPQMNEQARITEQADRQVNQFLAGFVEAHRTGDEAQLQATLHPSVRLAFGDDVCSEYIARTTGSLTGATLIEVGMPQSLDMNTPSGQINFPEAIPFTVEFEVSDGSSFVNDAHLPIHDGEAHWLTTCGVEAP